MCAKENSDIGNQNSKNKHSKSKNAEAKKKLQQNKNEKWLTIIRILQRKKIQAINLEMHRQLLCISDSLNTEELIVIECTFLLALVVAKQSQRKVLQFRLPSWTSSV